ncbi:hypothetical protein [Bacillus sp. Au-Bac7]|uniref:hypothetical protein n=1 Tax=Bacillus sp. Au-Bac7 TaxID=2906458 RepID=UPI001E5CC4AF|nr:hypothetical protein [Bacillus sp. Au-Bac7]MCE4051133.1 hypothetical protein [Bacillus sp. Au-Bac7]
MKLEQQQMVDKMREMTNKADAFHTEYWSKFADFQDWHFWLNIVFLVGPLIVLLIWLDRQWIFQILFFGFAIHAMMNYLDSIAVVKGLVTHPYPLMPLMNINLSINTSFIPVTFMLTYQYCINRKKNLYIGGLFASIGTGIVLGGFAQAIDYLQMYKWMNIWFVFVFDYLQFVTAVLLVKFFQYLCDKKKKESYRF